MLSISSKYMGLLDRKMIEDYGVSSLVLMEQGALRVLEAILQETSLENKAMLIFLGKGNNGGDGLALGRMATNLNCQVTYVELFPRGYSKEYELQKKAVVKMGLPLISLGEIEDLEQLCQEQDILVDGIFGTGFKGEMPLEIEVVLDICNRSRTPLKVAIDIPSGINGTTGKSYKYFKSTVTVALGYLKWGNLLGSDQGKLFLGTLFFNRALEEGIPLEHILFYYENNEVKELLPKRQQDGHKGTYGHVGVLGGSKEMLGASVLAGLGAFKTGAGKVTLWVDDEFTGTLANDPELMIEHWKDFLNKEIDVLVIGPGLGRTKVLNFESALRSFQGPVVIDGDGLWHLKTGNIQRQWFEGPVILTPHPQEMAFLLEKSTIEVNLNRLAAAKENSVLGDCISVLKGHKTIVHGKNSSYLNLTGNPGMGTAGSGDVLGGMIAAFLAKGEDPLVSARLGVYLHGLSGDLMAELLGEESLMARDILEGIPKAFKEIRSAKRNQGILQQIVRGR